MRLTSRALWFGKDFPLLKDFVSAWEFEDAGNLGLDGYGTNHLTNTNAVSRVGGIVGFSSAYVAADSRYLDIASNASLQTGDIDFTWAGFVYPEAAGGMVAGKSAADGSAYEWSLRQAFGEVYMEASGNGTVGSRAAVSKVAVAGAWAFVVASHDAANNLLSINVNNGTPATLAYSAGILAGSGAFFLGRATTGLSGYLDGQLDQVFLWKRLLTTAEQTWLYNGGAGRSLAAVRGYTG